MKVGDWIVILACTWLYRYAHAGYIISTYVGTGTGSFSGDNGQASSSTMNQPFGIIFDSIGNLYFSDLNNNRVRKIVATTGVISTYVGTGLTSYSGNGGVGSSATLYYPTGLSVDTSGIKKI